LGHFSNPADVDLLVLDVDGVLTAGQVVLDESGTLINFFNVHDGSGIKYWLRSGGRAAIISGRTSGAVPIRAKTLGIDLVYQGALRKIDAYRQCLADTRIDASRVCCVGDDLPDLPLLCNCGYPVAVANAVEEVKDRSAYVTRRTGGDGAVREVVEVLLRAKGLWAPIVDGYLQQKLSGDMV
jgi:3-deoxy-D-manno-octulosonate 8-phosphate phosphatase (KDO 8-P phosphatase)